MKKMVMAVLAGMMVVGSVSAIENSDLLVQMAKHETEHVRDASDLVGHQYIYVFGFHDFNTVVLLNSGLVVVLDEHWILKRGQDVVIKGEKIVIDGKSHKIISKFIFNK